jgi:hypothetical protein
MFAALLRDFAMKDMGPLHFLGITVEQRTQGLFLHQRQDALGILERAGISDCKPCSTHFNTQAKLSDDDRPSISDVMTYWSLIGAPSTSHSPGPTSLTRSNRRAFTCTHHGSPTHRSQADPSQLHRLQPPPSGLLDF